jgi:peptidyl-prolyl cis-trans isomerase A (cyclophilin A)
MKFLALFFLLAAPLHADLLATFATTRGNVVVSLHFDKTPQTVANFMTLAQGTRSRIDPATGAVIRKPLYAGETFYRVLNDFSGKLAQTGSGTGSVTGGPGYTFRDEFDASLRHGPYILAMQNDESPHTNGSQIYFTGDNGFPDDVGKNTVFGSITEASHGVVDAIIMAGSNLTTINSVSFQRTSPQAVAFDEHAQQLPECAGFAGNLEVDPGEYVKFLAYVPQPEGSFLFFSRSLNLQDWGAVNLLAYQATGMQGSVDFFIDDGMAKRAFYHFANVKHPDALAPEQSVLADETLSINLASGRNMVFSFTSGEVGTFTDSATSGSAAFTVVSYFPEPYKAIFIMESGALSYRFDCVLDEKVAGQVIGRCVAYEKSGNSWISLGAGALDLTQTQ